MDSYGMWPLARSLEKGEAGGLEGLNHLKGGLGMGAWTELRWASKRGWCPMLRCQNSSGPM